MNIRAEVTMGASVLVPMELGRLVVLTGPALDLLFLGEEPLELGVGLLDERRRLGEVLVAHRGFVDLRGLARGTATTATGADDTTARGPRGVTDGHRGLLGDLV